jgi:uncharacterized RDD family membrane protein YckC
MNYTKRLEILPDQQLILATIWKRFFALLIDWIILIILYFGILVVFSLFNMSISKINVHGIFDVELEMSNTPAYLIFFVKLFLGLLPVVYFVISFYFWKGKTIGKHFLRIRVISLHHERIGVWHCFERSLGYFASAVEFGFGFIQALWNPNRMALHDKIGETIVITLRPEKKTGKALKGLLPQMD